MEEAAPSGLNAAIRGELPLDALLRLGAERHGERVALTDDDRRRRGTGVSFAEVDRWVEGVAAAALGAKGLDPGSVVALDLPNQVESAIILLAVWRAGL